jgi:anthranilate/para-aminobenzoate synthase component I
MHSARWVDRDGLIIERLGPSPCPSVLLDDAGADDRPAILISGRGDPALSAWSYGALEPCGEAASLEDAEGQMRGWASGSVPPFCGGAIGWMSYDLGWRHQKRRRTPRADPLFRSASKFMLHDALYARDERTNQGLIVAQPTIAARRRAERLRRALSKRAVDRPGSIRGELAPGITRAMHLARIESTLEEIRRGEIYQLNLTYPLVGRFRGSPAAAFKRLLSSPPPFAAYLRVSRDEHIVSASPECFFDLDRARGQIAVYPIKGTRPRGASDRQDAALGLQLEKDEKERAEHLMIVDLLRNDLGEVAAFGTVGVDRLAYVERFQHVQHLTSRVVARLPPEVGLPRLVESLFPGGSITGVPKLRAMELIDELEGDSRGVYTGAIGYLTPDGSARMSIAIRTAQIANGDLRFGVGGGIVADSKPDREWEETVLKSRALAEALRG